MEKMKTNKGQDLAIHTTEGKLLIIACPGSGKTTTLIRRIHYMIEEKNINPQNILMITFTVAAAREMAKKYETLYGANAGVKFCTIHSLCYYIVKGFRKSEPLLISPEEATYCLKEAASKYSQIKDKYSFAKDVLLDIGVVKNKDLDYRRYIPQSISDPKIFRKMFEYYKEYKEDRGKMDYDDLLQESYQIFLHNPQYLKLYQKQFPYIQVDEYQDVSLIQKKVIHLLSGEEGNLAIVGDDDQSIYGFRGASPKLMMDFEKEWKKVTVASLDINYRSGSSIIESAKNVIEHNEQRFDKNFLGGRTEKGTVEIINLSNHEEEIRALSQRIHGLHKMGVDYDKIAVLTRTNMEEEPLVGTFLREDIPIKTKDTITCRYDHWIWRDILAYHKVSIGDAERSDQTRILNSPTRFLFGKRYTSCEFSEEALCDAVNGDRKKEDWQRRNSKEEIHRLFFVLRSIRESDPEHTMIKMERELTYKNYLHKIAEGRNQDPEELISIWDDIKKDAKRQGSWNKLLSYAFYFKQKIEERKNANHGVTLSTMHSSKGLEWDYVFIINCVEGICPFAKALEDGKLEEERRLFYVAMTRAKDSLTMISYKHRGNGKGLVQPSRFLAESEGYISI